MADYIASPEWERTECCHTEDEATYSKLLMPLCVGELLKVWVLNLSEEDETYCTEDVDSCNDDRGAGYDGAYTAEGVGILEASYEDGHLCNEARETWKTEVCQSGDDITHSKEWHNLHQSAKLTDVAGVCTTVDHTDKGEEEGCHKSVGEHLKDGTCA